MRNALLIAVFAMAWAVVPQPAVAADTAEATSSPSPLELVASLREAIQKEDAPWKDKYTAYKAVNEALKANPKDTAAAEAYATLQPQVATALRRENLPTSGWLMGFLGASLMWGGFAFCLGVARKSGKARPTSGE